MIFTKTGMMKAKQVLIWGFVPVEGGGYKERGIRGSICWEYYVYMYVNGKMRHGGVNSTIINCRNFCK
jgi:hypothetical protein